MDKRKQCKGNKASLGSALGLLLASAVTQKVVGEKMFGQENNNKEMISTVIETFMDKHDTLMNDNRNQRTEIERLEEELDESEDNLEMAKELHQELKAKKSAISKKVTKGKKSKKSF